MSKLGASAWIRRLTTIRQRKGMTVRELARRAEMQEASIRKIEAGERIPRLDTFVTLLWALDSDIDEFREARPARRITPTPRKKLHPEGF